MLHGTTAGVFYVGGFLLGGVLSGFDWKYTAGVFHLEDQLPGEVLADGDQKYTTGVASTNLPH